MFFREMTLPDVLAFLALADDLEIAPWLSGGWGVDSLLGEQTRRHADLDLFLPAHEAPRLTQHLSLRGFEPVPREDTCPWNFVYGDPHGREIDFHLIELDAEGNAGYGPEEVFPAELLSGYGTVGGRPVRCLAAQWEVRFHTGYEVDEDDWHDVALLCARFELPIPSDYDRFR
jgi:lincosamide nucleotidyltransferase A/C/D/E